MIEYELTIRVKADTDVAIVSIAANMAVIGKPIRVYKNKEDRFSVDSSENIFIDTRESDKGSR